MYDDIPTSVYVGLDHMFSFDACDFEQQPQTIDLCLKFDSEIDMIKWKLKS